MAEVVAELTSLHKAENGKHDTIALRSIAVECQKRPYTIEIETILAAIKLSPLQRSSTYRCTLMRMDDPGLYSPP